MRSIGQRLREVRGTRTLAEFSEIVGVGRTTWSNYEAGRRLPSHEVMEALHRIEGVPPDRILPSAALSHETVPTGSTDWWSYIPVLWLFSRLKGVGPFATEVEELAWWAERIPALSGEFEARTFELAEALDLDLEEAALMVCRDFASRTQSELFEFADHKK